MGKDLQKRTTASHRPHSASPTSDEQTPLHHLMTSPHSVVQLQRTIGNRAMSQMIQRKQKTETLDVIADKTDGVTYLKAVIGANSEWGRGSGPQAGQPSRIQGVGALKGRYVGGHMLNQEVGGDGTWDNMIVQSHTSNTNMNKHDNIIKRLGARATSLEEMGSTQEKQYEYYVIEEIDVNAANPDGNSNYPAEDHIPASLDVTLTPRKRHKGTKVVSDWTTGHSETISNPYHVVNVPPYPPKAARLGRGGSPMQQLKNRQQIEDKFKQRYQGVDAYRLKAKHFECVIGIGKVTAQAFEDFFKNYNVDLHTMHRKMKKKKDFTGNGFNLRHVALLIHAGLK